MAYLLDSNVFIEAKNRHYGMDFCPAFWDWLVRENRAGPDPGMLGSMAHLSEWVSGQSYRPAAVTTFLQDADYYLVAYAHAHAHTVVTHEVPRDGVKEVKIPNACIGTSSA